jgi:hypothetical protein
MCDQSSISSDLINDIKILNKIYDEYKKQSIKTYKKFQDIFNEYKNKIKTSDFGNLNIKIIKIISKFYKYNNKTNKVIVPIFYVSNIYYIYNIEAIHNLISGNLYITKCSYYNLQIKYGPLPENSYISSFHNWSEHYLQYKHDYPQYKNKEDFINAQVQNQGTLIPEVAALYNRFECEFIPFKSKVELIFEKNINSLEAKFSQLELRIKNIQLENDNSNLKEKLRECQIEIHYLKSCNPN